MIKIKKSRWLYLSLAVAMIVAMIPAFGGASGWDGSKDWTGQGSDDDPKCEMIDDGPYRTEDGWIHWILNQADGVTEAELVLGGSGGGYVVQFPSPIDPPRAIKTGGAIHFFTPYFDLMDGDGNLILTAVVNYNGTLAYTSQLVISDYCPGAYEQLAVSKTVVTSYTRTHEWDIDKSVDTEDGWMLDGYAKIWLFVDGSGDETATWTVDVTYEGYEDSDWNVSGEITIENTGTLDAVINSVVDVLGGTAINVDFGEVEFPFTLPKGETLTGTYSEDGYVEGLNVVTVTTEMDVYTASEPIVWGDPTTEVNKIVTIKDVSDLFDEVALGTVTAPNDAQFTYTKDFAWADYGVDGSGSYQYDNTATIVETGQSADATLKVNVQGFVYETAYAKGDSAVPFIPTFKNWGWTNPILPGTHTMALWAGAAQCDTGKGTLVGSVTVVYNGGGYVTAAYNVALPFILEETHFYAGYDMFPKDRKGNFTVAPGQYYNDGPFDGTDIYVIAHAVVGMPDPNFGP